MPFGSTKSKRREAARKHTRTVHWCPCGKLTRGNAHHLHKVKCPAWLENQEMRQNLMGESEQM